MIPEKDFSSMEFNPAIKGKILDKYPKLRGIIGDVDDRVARYILLMYDMKSPIRHNYPDLLKRKQFAADMAGFDVESEEVVGIFEFKVKEEEGYVPDDGLIDAVLKYLQYQNNMIFTMIVSNEQAFFEYNKRVMMPVEGSKDKDILQAVEIKTKIMAAMDEIFQRLQKYTRELTGSDDKLSEAITRKKMTTPESLAKR